MDKEWVNINSLRRFSSFSDDRPKKIWRMGSFFLKEDVMNEHLELVQKIFEKCVPFFMVSSFVRRGIEFHAHSELFDETPEGHQIPDYEIYFHESPLGKIEVEFRKAPLEETFPSSRKVTFK